MYFLYSHCLCEPFLKGSCANIDRATVKVEVALDSLVNGLQGPLSGKGLLQYEEQLLENLCSVLMSSCHSALLKLPAQILNV